MSRDALLTSLCALASRPLPVLPPDRPGEPGWQLLHFTRA